MAEAISALQGRVVKGGVTVRDTGLRGMITLRGDLTNSKLRTVCTGLTGVDFPGTGEASSTAHHGLAWMSPDEVLIMLDYDRVDEALGKIHKALKGQHYLAVNVSDARAVLTVEGAYAREVIAKLAPVDLHPDSFGMGQFRRTRLGQIAAAFWLREPHLFEVICFRSVAHYALDLLAASAESGPVGHFPAAH